MSSEGKSCAGAQSQVAQAATMQNASKQTDALQISYHGIAARMDRLPISNFHRKLLWLLGGVVFCDSIDMGIGGPIIAQLLATGWSDAGLNSLFVSITMLGYFFGGLMAGALSDSIGRKKAVIIFCLFFTVGCFAAAFSPDMYFLIVWPLYHGSRPWRGIPCSIFGVDGIYACCGSRSVSGLRGTHRQHGYAGGISTQFADSSAGRLASGIHLLWILRALHGVPLCEILAGVSALVGHDGSRSRSQCHRDKIRGRCSQPWCCARARA